MLVAILIAVGVSASMLGAVGTAQASNKLGINAWDLYEGKVQLRLGQNVRMWECWKDGVGETPEMLQWVDGRWIFLSKSTAIRNSSHCPSNAPYLAKYRFTVEHQGAWNARKGYYELKVKTQCDTCVTYVWKLPIKGVAP
jgi:hypothetical protein